MCDPISAFGGIVAINSIVSKKLANELNKLKELHSKGILNDDEFRRAKQKILK